ncbi:hypothetical protein NIES267_09300 [Calothrix parasitica NIES-267]|uniref:Uncharacterized protein n=1 Tax=Calothrix parasitica NIES-267 TaxID=1973488 RepID=A0A1Z4LJT5_9CYAN|nr:hypothetical protein NIES267_09300 [Calothrix parasitica NIES-267]
MKQQSREKILEFLADLSAPVDPEVFAGFGSKLQRNRYEWQKQECEFEKEEEYICCWVEEQEVMHTLDILFDIARNPPGIEFCNGIYQRRKSDWEYFLILLIYLLGKKDKVTLLNQIEDNNQDKKLYPIIEEVKQYLADD